MRNATPDSRFPTRLTLFRPTSSRTQRARDTIILLRFRCRIGNNQPCIRGEGTAALIPEGQTEIGGGLKFVIETAQRIAAKLDITQADRPGDQSDRRIDDRAIEILPRQRPNIGAKLLSRAAARQVINGRMVAAPNARNSGLVGGIKIDGPLLSDWL